MLACVKGFKESVQLLLEAGADPNKKDAFGGTAMCVGSAARRPWRRPGIDNLPAVQPKRCAASHSRWSPHSLSPDALHRMPCCRWEACQHGHDDCVELLLAAGGRWAAGHASSAAHPQLDPSCPDAGLRDVWLAATSRPSPTSEPSSLGKEGVDEASLLCTCVFAGELGLLRRLLRSGAHPDGGDYDRRTPLHIAAGASLGAWVGRAQALLRIGGHSGQERGHNSVLYYSRAMAHSPRTAP